MGYHDTKMMLPFLLIVWCQNGGVVVVDDASMAKMSGGDVDVEPYLNSLRNTRGHETAAQILEGKCVKIVGIGNVYAMVVYVGNGGAMWKWWWYAEVRVGTGAKFGES